MRRSATVITEARRRNAPVLLRCHMLAGTDFAVVQVLGLEVPRSYALVTPGYGEPTGAVREPAGEVREHIRIWLR